MNGNSRFGNPTRSSVRIWNMDILQNKRNFIKGSNRRNKGAYRII